jgi:hypothetical protein
MLAVEALARGCSLASQAGWPEMEGGAALCRPARNAPKRLQGVAGVAHRARRSRLEFHVKAGNAGEVARLMDEGGEEVWLGWAPSAAGGGGGGGGSGGGGGGGGALRARRMRWPLFDLPCRASRREWPVWPPKGHDAAAEVLRLRAPEGRRHLWPLPPRGAFSRADCGPVIRGSLEVWRAMNPRAEYANVGARSELVDADFAHLVGVKFLDMRWCAGITNAGLAHLAGIRLLNMTGCTGVTDAGLAHLSGIHTLIIAQCPGLTDAGLAHLRGIHSLHIYACPGLTDAGFAHLVGIHSLHMYQCPGVTDAGLSHLAGIHTLGMPECTQFSDAGLAHLRGIHTLKMQYCHRVTDAGLAHLAGICKLDMRDCAGITGSGLAHLRGVRFLDTRGCADSVYEAEAEFQLAGASYDASQADIEEFCDA